MPGYCVRKRTQADSRNLSEVGETQFSLYRSQNDQINMYFPSNFQLNADQHMHMRNLSGHKEPKEQFLGFKKSQKGRQENVLL